MDLSVMCLRMAGLKPAVPKGTRFYCAALPALTCGASTWRRFATHEQATSYKPRASRLELRARRVSSGRRSFSELIVDCALQLRSSWLEALMRAIGTFP